MSEPPAIAGVDPAPSETSFNKDLMYLTRFRNINRPLPQAVLTVAQDIVVARDGIEPPTPAFSGPRSTN